MTRVPSATLLYALPCGRSAPPWVESSRFTCSLEAPLEYRHASAAGDDSLDRPEARNASSHFFLRFYSAASLALLLCGLWARGAICSSLSKN